MRLLLAGGGTGGHLFPAVALAQLLLHQDRDAAVLFVGTDKGLERRMLPKLGLPLATVDMVGVVGRGWRGRLELLPKLLRSLIQARNILKQFAPEIVVGVGGYVSVPVLLAAKWLHIPYVIHEQNAFAGLSNRLLARWAQLVCLSFPQSGSGLAVEKSLVTGNPLRSGFEEIADSVAEPNSLLVFGGSRGARAINEALVDLLPLLKSWEQPPSILHQTGDEDFAMVEQAYRDAGYPLARVVPFIDNMAQAYQEASLVVCRAGATTLAELTVCGRPAILIPYPYAAADHQTANAEMLEKAGAARMIKQQQLSAGVLAKEIGNLMNDESLLRQMSANARSLGRPGAAEKILAECRALVATRSRKEH